MKYLVDLILSACIFITLCNASCMYTEPPELKEGLTLKGCERNGKLHNFGTEWKDEDCYECQCLQNGSLKCCINIEKPSNYDPERCFFEFDKKACKYKLIPNEDPEKQCLSYSVVG
ncbi:hypothetical protein GDO81_004365 [Engystomops pustulosus]|uniref:Beta-microseminoprotein n=1 Tax=Engystomops pustulosus TaxID=76066 RepID=A0AAV6ZRT1_ENGPU|nr:hypothetical protein GDO81_004365 [Engystomops pustulosus]